MRLPYLSSDTKLTLFVSSLLLSCVGFGILGLIEIILNIKTLDAGIFVSVLVLSCLGIVFGSIFGIQCLFDFIDEFKYDKRHERYRTVKTC